VGRWRKEGVSINYSSPMALSPAEEWGRTVRLRAVVYTNAFFAPATHRSAKVVGKRKKSASSKGRKRKEWCSAATYTLPPGPRVDNNNESQPRTFTLAINSLQEVLLRENALMQVESSAALPPRFRRRLVNTSLV
jgi:hypothetical protein